VESLLPNEAGLFDMHGNLFEWTQNLVSGPSSPVKDGITRVLRGGSFVRDMPTLRSDHRSNNGPMSRFNNFGFRPARNFPPAVLPLYNLSPKRAENKKMK
jgi:sulfatase modifying factor 1